MQKQVKCEFCRKFAETKQVMRFPPFNFIHIDGHGCLVKYLAQNHPQVLETFTDEQRFALAKKL